MRGARTQGWEEVRPWRTTRKQAKPVVPKVQKGPATLQQLPFQEQKPAKIQSGMLGSEGLSFPPLGRPNPSYSQNQLEEEEGGERTQRASSFT